MAYFVGIDISQRQVSICVLDQEGKRLWRGKCLTDPAVITATLQEKVPDGTMTLGLETGPLSPWLVHSLRQAGHTVVCLDARAVHAALSTRINKNDQLILDHYDLPIVLLLAIRLRMFADLAGEQSRPEDLVDHRHSALGGYPAVQPVVDLARDPRAGAVGEPNRCGKLASLAQSVDLATAETDIGPEYADAHDPGLDPGSRRDPRGRRFHLRQWSLPMKRPLEIHMRPMLSTSNSRHTVDLAGQALLNRAGFAGGSRP